MLAATAACLDLEDLALTFSTLLLWFRPIQLMIGSVNIRRYEFSASSDRHGQFWPYITHIPRIFEFLSKKQTTTFWRHGKTKGSLLTIGSSKPSPSSHGKGSHHRRARMVSTSPQHPSNDRLCKKTIPGPSRATPDET